MSTPQPLSEIHQAHPGYRHHELNTTPVLVEAETLARPLGVTVVAGFQFFKAAILLLTGMLLRLVPNAVLSPKSLLYPLLFIATRGKFAEMHDEAAVVGNILPTILTILGVYLAVVGFGMWRVRLWARKSALMNSGITLLLFARTQLSPPPPVGDTASPDLLYLHILLALDALIFLYLVRGSTFDLFQAVAWRRRENA